MRHARKDYNRRIQEVGPVVMALVAHLTSLDRTIMMGAAHEVPLLLDEVVRWMEDQGLDLYAEPRIGAEEPVFLLRAQDQVAGMTVREWASLVAGDGGDPALRLAALEWAEVMEDWGTENGYKVPDTPHELLEV